MSITYQCCFYLALSFYKYAEVKVLEISWIFYFLLLGGVVGFIAGLLGVGGGGVLVPVLSFMFLKMGIAQENVMHMSLGTSMACIIVTSLSSSYAHHKKGGVKWDIVKGMSIGVMLGTYTATFIASYLDSIYLALIFACFMTWAAVNMFSNKQQVNVYNRGSSTRFFIPAFGIGNISALVSIGGGSLTVPYLIRQNVDMKSAVGTSAAIGLPISVAGTLGYLLNGLKADQLLAEQAGFIYLPAVVLISASSFLTVPLGVKTSHQLKVKTLKRVFSLLLIILSVKMFWLFL